MVLNLRRIPNPPLLTQFFSLRQRLESISWWKILLSTEERYIFIKYNYSLAKISLSTWLLLILVPSWLKKSSMLTLELRSTWVKINHPTNLHHDFLIFLILLFIMIGSELKLLQYTFCSQRYGIYMVGLKWQRTTTLTFILIL